MHDSDDEKLRTIMICLCSNMQFLEICKKGISHYSIDNLEQERT